jgi:hypothetical protein
MLLAHEKILLSAIEQPPRLHDLAPIGSNIGCANAMLITPIKKNK